MWVYDYLDISIKLIIVLKCINEGQPRYPLWVYDYLDIYIKLKTILKYPSKGQIDIHVKITETSILSVLNDYLDIQSKLSWN